jgi:phosphatidylserine/phosphatidylglycerophosphate/cardiolipin synthase-like enzyme
LRPVYEALVAKVEENPEIQVRVYLDGQEYVSQWAHNNQLEDQQQCLNDAGESVSKQQKCLDKGFRYSYATHLAGIPLRFKYYAYRWHYTYAAQMHHKYLLVDGRYLAMGSYNLSDNAEHNTFENLLIFDGNAVPELVQSFKDNFDAMWQTGVGEKLYDGLISEIENATEGFPIVFDSMALTWDQVSALKDLIQEHCPQVNSEEYRNDPGKHTWCDFND